MTILRVRQLRKQAGLTLGQLAADCGVTPAHLSRVERGIAIPSDMLEAKIAHALGLSRAERAFMLGCGRMSVEPRIGLTLLPPPSSS